MNQLLMSTAWEQEEAILTLEEVGEPVKVILYNDDVNTFDWVIECLVRICKHDSLQAEQCAWLVHYKGKASVKSGTMEEMQMICTALCDKGLSAIIE